MAHLKLFFSVPGFTLGADGSKYKTEPLAEEKTMHILDLSSAQKQPVSGGAGPKMEKCQGLHMVKGCQRTKFFILRRYGRDLKSRPT